MRMPSPQYVRTVLMMMAVVLLVGCANAPTTPMPTGDPAWLRPQDAGLYHYLRQRGFNPNQGQFEEARDLRARVLSGQITMDQAQAYIQQEEDRALRELEAMQRMDAATPAYQPPLYFGQYNLGRFGNYTCTTMPQFGWQTCNPAP